MHVSDEGHARPAGSGAAPHPAISAGRPLCVLLVDDEEAIRTTIAMVLARRGHRVVGARDVEEGRARAREEAFDAALVDLRLPGNGLVLLRELEASAGLRGKTVLVTGSAEAEWPRRLAKPFDFGEMVELVEAVGGL